MKFKHSSAERNRTQSIWVETRNGSYIGRGESCPREYVTNETIASAKKFFLTHLRSLSEIKELEDLNRWSQNHKATIDQNQASWCAIELSCLEWLANREGIPVEEILSLPRLKGAFQYSAVVGDSDANTFRKIIKNYRDKGFSDFKLKLSGNFDLDRDKIRSLHALNINGLRIRVDANNLWTNVDIAAKHLENLSVPFLGVEEPLGVNNIADLRKLSVITNTPIILDESLLRADQISSLARDPEHWVVNIRVSKMGGLLRSLETAKRACEAGIPIIVGAQVGETSLLTRAALVVARAAGKNLLAQEGAFGTLLLETDVTNPPLMFGQDGVLDLAAYNIADAPGWGIPFVKIHDLMKRPY